MNGAEIPGIDDSLGEEKGDHMTQMHAVAARASTGI